MYSWPIGICLSKPASMRKCDANQPMTSVNTTSAPRMAARCRKANVSNGRTARASMAGCGLEVARQRQSDEVAVAQGLVEHPLAAPEGRVVDRSLPRCRVLDQADDQV